jgi:hypothetical protein
MFDEPRAVQAVARLANYIQPTLADGLRIWWAFYWRTLLLTYVTVIVLNIGIRALWSAGLMPAAVTQIAAFVIRYDNYPIYYGFAFVALAIVLRKSFRGFRIALLSNYGTEGAQELPPTFARTARVWWTFCWRAVVYRVVLTVAIMFPMGWIAGFLTALIPSNGFAALLYLAMQILLDAVVGAFVIYSNILDEDISDFRVALVPRGETASAITTPTTADVQPG